MPHTGPTVLSHIDIHLSYSPSDKSNKQHGAPSVGEFREQGNLPEANVNLLSLLGCNDVIEQVNTTGIHHEVIHARRAA